MAALFPPTDNSEHAAPREESFNEETLDQSCDVILVVEDGKEFKAHKRVLSEASPVFEKMFRSDMKESKEGMVRLEMFSESAMRDTLEFIYTGSVQILAEHNARDLIVIADYLFLEHLKTLAEEFLLQTLNTSNCFPTYYLSQRYPQCEGLFVKRKTFILENFTAVCEANPEEILNMSSKEIEMWISSDEIDVSAEEDVFRIILAWINHDKSKRNRYFADLFRQVRLVYVSRDFICSDVMTNDHVKYNEGCLDLVWIAMKLIDSEKIGNLSVRPRKSLETPVIFTACTYDYSNLYTDLQCYFPREHRWCSLGEIRPISSEDTVSCQGKLYSMQWRSCQMTSYDLYSNCGMSLPQLKDREFWKIFVSNEDEIYALVSERQWNCVSYITKYNLESNSWEDISLFDKLNFRRTPNVTFCIVAKDNYIYLIGGVTNESGKMSSTAVRRFDLSRNQWDKVADIQESKIFICGAVVNGKIFIAGKPPGKSERTWCQCEVYNETTNEWQFIESFNMMHEYAHPKLLSVDEKLYALSIIGGNITIGYYYPDTDLWSHFSNIPHVQDSWYNLDKSYMRYGNAFSGKIFKGFLDHQLKSLYHEKPFTSRHLAIVKQSKQRRDRDEADEVDVMQLDPCSFVRRDRPLCKEPVYLRKHKCCFIM